MSFEEIQKLLTHDDMEAARQALERMMGNRFAKPVTIVSAPVRTAPRAEVPRIWELLVSVLIAPERQAERLGCFEERFHIWTEKYGPFAARRIYAWHALRSIWDTITARIKSLSDGDP